jgi:uncharacterized membrane protein
MKFNLSALFYLYKFYIEGYTINKNVSHWITALTRRDLTMKKLSILGFIMGMMYFTAEGFWRGWTNIVMLFIGGLCCVLIGLLDEFPKHYNLKIWQQCILGTTIILIIEFISGLIVNIWLKLHIWDYSDRWGNIKGQICITYGFLWFILTPFVIWLDDFLRWKIYGEEEPYNIKQIYKKLIKFN